MPDRQTIKQLGDELGRRRKELLERLEMNEDEWSELQAKQVELEERATNEFLAATFAGLDDQVVRELGRIDRALQKIDNGTYGICETCGREISIERLKALPEAATCMRCAADKQPGSAPEVSTVGSGRKTMPTELQGLEDDQLADRVMEYIRIDRRIPTEELEISCHQGVVALRGYLPSEKTRQILLQVLEDNLGLPEIEDYIVIDRVLWQNRKRTPGRNDTGRTDYEQAAEGEGSAATGAFDSQKSGMPMDPADEFVPEKK
jgi:DnaK suppressor protein